jgi:hypothetical protein
MRLRRSFAWLPVLLLLGACQSMSVDSYSEPGVKWNGLSTYRWLSTRQRVSGSPRAPAAEVDASMKKLIDEGLRARGLKPSTTGTPDLWVTFHVNLVQDLTVEQVTYNYGAYNQMWNAGVQTNAATEVYDQGTLVIDLLSGKDRHLIWRGSAEAKIQSATGPEDRDRIARKAVHDLLEQYPPQ